MIIIMTHDVVHGVCQDIIHDVGHDDHAEYDQNDDHDNPNR